MVTEQRLEEYDPFPKHDPLALRSLYELKAGFTTQVRPRCHLQRCNLCNVLMGCMNTDFGEESNSSFPYYECKTCHYKDKPTCTLYTKRVQSTFLRVCTGCLSGNDR